MIKTTRDEYKKLKKLDHRQMDEYLNSIYNSGYNAGVSTITKKVVDCIDNGIKNTKGIGKKLYDALMANITIEMNKE